MEEFHPRINERISCTQLSIYDLVPTFQFLTGVDGNEESQASPGNQIYVAFKG